MDIFAILQSKKNKEAYQLLLLLEKQSEESAELYPLFEDFLGLLGSESAFVRVRGFRLACAQAKWDTENKLGTHLDRLLTMLDGEKPTAVRQCLAALGPVVRTKPDLAVRIRSSLDSMEPSRYGSSMAPLIEKDRLELKKLVELSAPDN